VGKGRPVFGISAYLSPFFVKRKIGFLATGLRPQVR
jgi:hypothetical protein